MKSRMSIFTRLGRFLRFRRISAVTMGKLSNSFRLSGETISGLRCHSNPSFSVLISCLVAQAYPRVERVIARGGSSGYDLSLEHL